jgi:metal-responsive CopG/Arc/MetJ family transcriptional regulator
MFGVREAKKRVECKLEEELVDRIDRVAELLKTNRTDIVRSACIAYLKNTEIGAKKSARTGIYES